MFARTGRGVVEQKADVLRVVMVMRVLCEGVDGAVRERERERAKLWFARCNTGDERIFLKTMRI